MYDRTIKILGEQVLKKIQNVNVLLIGLGGVGGYALECLVRTGFLKITVVDADSIEKSNLNRQILATERTLNIPKVTIAQQRAAEINIDCEVRTIQKYLKKEDISYDFLKNYDYIIDACDSKEVKIELIKVCIDNHLKLVSAMGTANKTHPELLEIIKLKNTSYDPLARSLRAFFKANSKYLNVSVVCSREVPKKQNELGTIVCVPMSAGSLLASYIINDIKNETTST